MPDTQPLIDSVVARSLASSVYLGSPTVLGGLSITCCGYCFAKECCIGEYVSEALTSAEIISHRCVLLCNVVLSDYAAIGGVSVRKLLPAPLARYAALSKEPIALVVMRKPTQPFTTRMSANEQFGFLLNVAQKHWAASIIFTILTIITTGLLLGDGTPINKAYPFVGQGLLMPWLNWTTADRWVLDQLEPVAYQKV